MGDRRVRALMELRPGHSRRAQRSLVLGGVLVLALGGSTRAAAQTTGDPKLAGMLPELILREITLPRPTVPGLSHEAHFSPFVLNDLENPAVAVVENFNKLLIVQLSTFPLGSSAGGFSYTFDPELGTFRRASNSFGPSFAERAATIGRRRFSAGFNYQHTRYNRIEGSALGDRSIRFYLRHQECCTATSGPPVPPFFGVVPQPDGTRLTPFFEGDVIEAALSLNVTTDALVLFGNYGITDRWDVGIAAPLVRVDLEASVQANILRLATFSNPAIHSFEAGNPDATQREVTRSGSATGIGDVVLRSKFRLFDLAAGGVAAAVDVRLPTGDQENLLGGSTQTKLMLVESGGTNRVVQHVNIGYTISGSRGSGAARPAGTGVLAATDFPDEFNYAVGAELVAHPRVTVIGDIVGRTLRGAGRLKLASKTFQYMPAGATAPAATQFDEFEPRAGSPNLLFATAGVKVNPTGNLLFSANVLVPLTNTGLRGGLSTIVGMDYAF